VVRSLPQLTAAPNPFRARTTVACQVERPGRVLASVYDAGGRLVGVLPGMSQGTGTHTFVWDAAGCEPGIYLLKLNTGSETRSLRLVKTN